MSHLEALTVADFSPLLNDRFTISTDNLSFDAHLVEVAETARAPGGRAPFSLVFQGGPNPPLRQGIVRVEHDQLGPIDIFLVPIASSRYEAVFT